MNAVLREEDEIRMVANETIEAHIQFLRAGLDEVKLDVRKLLTDSSAMHITLRDKIDDSRKELRSEIDAVKQELTQKIDTVNKDLTQKIDTVKQELTQKVDTVKQELTQKIDTVKQDLTQKIDTVKQDLTQKIDTVNKDLTQKIDGVNQKIDNLSTGFAELRGFHKTVLWVCGGIVTAVTVGLSVGKAFHWY